MSTANGWCDKCGHRIEYHGSEGCDVEVRDYGDTDCRCTEWRPLLNGEYPPPGPVVSAGPRHEGFQALFVQEVRS